MHMFQQANEPLHAHEEPWRLTASLPSQDGVFLCIEQDGRLVLRAARQDGELIVTVRFTAREEPLVLRAAAGQARGFALQNEGHRLALYLDGSLGDEDWPLGRVPLDGAVWRQAPAGAALSALDPCDEPADGVLRTFTGAAGWKPAGHNTHVGDCMPFAHGGVFHLFYLFDRRGHGSKWGLGAHQWGHISSADLITWREHPLAIGIDRQPEGSICTGSLVFHEGRYVAFYAVRMCDGSPAQLTWAASTDGIRFLKSGERFTLEAPYDAASARDPHVFAGEDGVFHMLVTTSLRKGGVSRGCLAHLTSPDLRHWQPREPAVVLPIEDQPECSDYFRVGELYYLVYSNGGVAHYFWSRRPFGPWTAPADNVVVDEGFRVPKRAAWTGGRVIFAGFRIDSDVTWGGTVHFYEARPQADGSLIFDSVPEVAGTQLPRG